jgi:hypothetical protein
MHCPTFFVFSQEPMANGMMNVPLSFVAPVCVPACCRQANAQADFLSDRYDEFIIFFTKNARMPRLVGGELHFLGETLLYLKLYKYLSSILGFKGGFTPDAFTKIFHK